jgi:hypothetical protein
MSGTPHLCATSFYTVKKKTGLKEWRRPSRKSTSKSLLMHHSRP